ncbi:VanZ family protein [Blastopirellula sp. JC732]|uniref:VanZ family protein n=1 Tax=Blastopirellula sediminis TaxID=2894196 RepID=A0A9X1MJN9_9BACT|nr:VanZ family protein [Blastopirellula sediminis]MCC9609667.1 VanZ family protein [Blastopirellula sediminis]MCC9627557.1 VanZ family protein [Blastopirellula sediminis]
MNRLVAARWYILAGALWLSAFVATHWPGERFPTLLRGWENWDKAIHFSMFVVLGLILSVIAGRFSKIGPLFVWPVLAAYGLLDEVTQSFVPGRTCDGLDWMTDCLGAAVGVGLYFLFARLRNPEPAETPLSD